MRKGDRRRRRELTEVWSAVHSDAMRGAVAGLLCVLCAARPGDPASFPRVAVSDTQFLK